LLDSLAEILKLFNIIYHITLYTSIPDEGKSKDVIFIKSISRNSIVSKIEIEWAFPSQAFGSTGWLILYDIGIFVKP